LEVAAKDGGVFKAADPNQMAKETPKTDAGFLSLLPRFRKCVVVDESVRGLSMRWKRGHFG